MVRAGRPLRGVHPDPRIPSMVAVRTSSFFRPWRLLASDAGGQSDTAARCRLRRFVPAAPDRRPRPGSARLPRPPPPTWSTPAPGPCRPRTAIRRSPRSADSSFPSRRPGSGPRRGCVSHPPVRSPGRRATAAGAAELVFSLFNGTDGGPTDMNIDRWVGQFRDARRRPRRGDHDRGRRWPHGHPHGDPRRLPGDGPAGAASGTDAVRCDRRGADVVSSSGWSAPRRRSRRPARTSTRLLKGVMPAG